MKESTVRAVDTFYNGNIQDFKDWLRHCSKADLLDAIEYYSGNYGSRHIIINYMMRYLRNGG